ncbi:MAG: UpxY family transcription antiterminator [Acidobacteria bacterium]|nr:UpxY family transcription antiterminator [Acidobacteriota bacterium]
MSSLCGLNPILYPLPALPDCSVTPRWYVVQTRSRFEKAVRSELAAQGMENYLPAVTELHQWKDRRKLVDQPLFPGYVFVRFTDAAESRRHVLRIQGVVRLLGGFGGIEPVPDEEIESIQRLLESTQSCFAHPFLREGAWVRVRRGVLRGMEGWLVRVKNRTRLVLSISLLSQSVATEIDAKDVEVIRAAPAPGEHLWQETVARIEKGGPPSLCIRI